MMVKHLFADVLNVSITTSTLVAVLLLLFPLLTKNNLAAKWRCAVWLLLTLRLLLPFSLAFPSTPITLPQLMLSYPASNRLIEIDVQADDSDNLREPGLGREIYNTGKNTDSTMVSSQSGTQQKRLGESFLNADLLILIWLGGMVLSASYLLYSYILFRRSVFRWCRPVSDNHILNIWGNLLSEMDVHKDIRLMVCKKVNSPILAGFIKPAVLLPKEGYDDETLLFILRHELMHYKRFDLYYKLLLKSAQVIHWFNPIIFLFVRIAEHDIEMSCDDAVVQGQNVDYRLRYCDAILSAVTCSRTRFTAFSTHFNGGTKHMKKRFSNILRSGKIKGKGIFTVCALAILAITTGSVLAFESPKAANSVENTVAFTLLAENSKWIRSTNVKEWYDPMYTDKYPDSSVREEASKHVLFEMPVGASASSYFYTNIGFERPHSLNDVFSPGEYLDNVGLLLLNSRIQRVLVMDNHVTIVAESLSSGYQVISISRADLPEDLTRIKLVTLAGQEIDQLVLQD